MAQVNHYLAVSGFDCWYIAALIFGKELVIHKIISDKVVLNNLIAKEEHFWKYNVMPEITPVPTGSEGDTQQINQLYSAMPFQPDGASHRILKFPSQALPLHAAP